MLDFLKRQLVHFRTLVLDTYDKLEAAPDLISKSFAITVDNRRDRMNPVRLDEDFFFPSVHGWESQAATIAGLDRIEFTVPMKGWDAFLPFNNVNIDRPDTVAKIERLVKRLPEAYFRNQTRLLMNVFRKNPVCYDGQNFFANAHVHPGGQGTYDNTIAHGFATAGSPTVDEVKALLHAIMSRFITNLAIQSEVIDGSSLYKNLVVVVHNATHHAVFERVRTMPRIDTFENEFVGAFRLLLDNQPTAGQENYIEFQLTEPNGPRPAFLVLDKDPVLDAWNEKGLPDGYTAIGLRGIFGAKAAYPQGSIQAQNS